MKVGVISPRTLVRKALCGLLAGAGIFASVMDFDSALGAARTNDKSQPSVLIVSTPTSQAGIDAVLQLRVVLPRARVLLLADETDVDFSVQALEAGAWGCVSTAETPQVLVKAAKKVADGERWFPHRVTDKVIEKHVSGRGTNMMLTETLTPREWEVLGLVAKGHSDKEVASSLFISKETARSHVKSIYKKLQISTRQAAAVYFFEHAPGQHEVAIS